MDVIIGPFLQLIMVVLDLYKWVIIIQIILSWLVSFNVVNTQNRVVYIIGDITHRLTEPVMGPIRRKLPNFSGLDLSPIVVLLGIMFIEGVVQNLYFNLAH